MNPGTVMTYEVYLRRKGEGVYYGQGKWSGESPADALSARLDHLADPLGYDSALVLNDSDEVAVAYQIAPATSYKLVNA
jgi:hypothetical protein